MAITAAHPRGPRNGWTTRNARYARTAVAIHATAVFCG
jgi:hypothetical protein